MNESWGAFAAGGFLVLLGAGMMFAHHRAWSRQRGQDEETEPDRQHYFRRYRRRMQTSGLILLLGLMVGLSPLIIPDPKQAPRLFGAWWLSALLVAGWIILLAFGDMLATRAHSQVALSRIRLRQLELEQKLANLHRRDGDRPE